MMPKVLIVDDDADFLETAFLLIKSKGYECEKASNIKDAVASASLMPPDCCILDIRLENPLYDENPPDGVDLFEELKRLLNRCRVIFASAHSDYEEGYLVRRGAVALIAKDDFAERIDRALKEVFYPRVLLVEDDVDFSTTASNMLNLKAITCIPINDKKQMKEYLRQCDFTAVDIVITDVLLDDDDRFHGWDVVNLIPSTYPMEFVYLLTNKTLPNIKTRIGELFHDLESREKFLAAITGLPERQVLDKGNWIDTIDRACRGEKTW